MGFDSGSVSFRLFRLSQSFGPELVEAFADHAAPPIEYLASEPIFGWVGGRHLLDRNLTEDSCVIGGYLHATFLKAERKIPESLLRAHCRMEEEIELRARECEVLPRAVRAEVRERVREQLLPTMPPTLTGMPVVVDFRNDLLLAGAMSDKQVDTLVPYFRETAGVMPLLLTPETVALQRKHIKANDLAPVTFSPDPAMEPIAEADLGMDFLTWLWFFWESDGGVIRLSNGRQAGIMLEGPLTFFREGEGAHEALLRKGSPLDSREAGVALVCGKKLKRVKLVIAEGEQVMTATVDSEFAFRGLKLPKVEQLDAAGKFQERMIHIENYWSICFELYDRFLDLRVDTEAWAAVTNEIHEWVTRRAG
ncbi:MAG: recombination-associated protein RdgC [Lentisphaerae bacterium]|jgi:hypothetical protein|nr:recombination-associated protein RdgC [Lentisphaerota bacterium]